MSEPKTLYCPICGHRMSKRDSGWYCNRGHTRIAKIVIDKTLEAMERIPAKRPSQTPEKKHNLFGHCPRCSTKFVAVANAVRVCPKCSLSLPGGIFYVLQERHSHTTSLQQLRIRIKRFLAKNG